MSLNINPYRYSRELSLIVFGYAIAVTDLSTGLAVAAAVALFREGTYRLERRRSV